MNHFHETITSAADCLTFLSDMMPGQASARIVRNHAEALRDLLAVTPAVAPVEEGMNNPSQSKRDEG